MEPKLFLKSLTSDGVPDAAIPAIKKSLAKQRVLGAFEKIIVTFL